MSADDSTLELFRRLREHSQLSSGVFGDRPPWIGLAWTRILVALAGETIEYLDGQWRNDDPGFTVEIVAYTPSRVVRLSAHDTETQPAIRTWTFSRHRLQCIEVNGGSALVDPAFQPNWPGRVTCTANYPEETITLPQPGADRAQYSSLMNFLPSLMSDMALRDRAVW